MSCNPQRSSRDSLGGGLDFCHWSKGPSKTAIGSRRFNQPLDAAIMDPGQCDSYPWMGKPNERTYLALDSMNSALPPHLHSTSVTIILHSMVAAPARIVKPSQFSLMLGFSLDHGKANLILPGAGSSIAQWPFAGFLEADGSWP